MAKLIVTLKDPVGRSPGISRRPYGSPESRAAYTRVIGEWQASHRGVTGRIHWAAVDG